MKQILLIMSLLISLSGITQEICNNGIDDDADGLIDLQDFDCQCGAGLNTQINNAIPNPGFNNSSCCPSFSAQNFDCLDDWVTDDTYPNYALSIAYFNTCNNCATWSAISIWPPECGITGNTGFIAMTFRNYGPNTMSGSISNNASSCLNTPLYPNHTYVLNFDAFSPYNYFAQYSGNPVYISLSGSTSCTNIPVNTNSAANACSDPNWSGLDSLEIVVPVDTAWHQYSFSFTPTDTIYAISLGQTCSSINGLAYNDWQRLFIDNLTLSKLYDLQIAESGSVCAPPHVLTSTIDTTGGTWQWYKDSIALIGEINPLLDITTLGTGNYTILYRMNGTCQGLNLEVLEPVYPTVFQTPIVEPICVGDSVYFDGFSSINSGTIDSNYFSFGNGDSAFVENPGYIYNIAGTYTVNFIVESNLGCIENQEQIITIYEKPEVNFLANNECIYDSVNFVSLTNITNSFIDSLAWDFDDNSISNDSLSSHLYNNVGNFDVRLYARSDQGCIDSITKTITINPAPISGYFVSSNCENIGIPFTNSSSISTGIITSYDWDFDDNSNATTFNPNHTFQTYGNFNTSLLVTSDSGCVDSSNFQLVIYPKPTASFTSNSSCLLANFNNTSTIPNGTITQANWNFGNAILDSAYNTSHLYTANGNYNVSLQIISNFGCENDTIIPITILNNFTADFTPKVSSVCVGNQVQFNNMSTSVPGQEVNYLWKMSDGQTSEEENPTFSFSNNNPLIDIFLKISTSSGCIDSVSQLAAISVIPLPNADFSFTPEELTLTDPEVSFLNQSTFAENYWWNFGDNNYSTEISPTYIYPEISKAYTITLIASDIDSVCSDEYSRTLIVQDEILFFIPNAFTPDGSGKNDLFSPQFISGIDVYNFKLQIFNRWGEIVFESNDPTFAWNGKYAGEPVQQGVYIWKIDFEESILDKTHTHTGTVNVLR